ncbi:hypothetical protein BX616_010673 [Lobosporangium transversale]|nr:hypothetical protein BX616_010673 [Lobosporangium transversale]
MTTQPDSEKDSLTEPSKEMSLKWLEARFGPYSAENPPPHSMEASVRAGDYHAVAFILAQRRRSRSSAQVADTVTDANSSSSLRPDMSSNLNDIANSQSPLVSIATPQSNTTHQSNSGNGHNRVYIDNSGHPFSFKATLANNKAATTTTTCEQQGCPTPLAVANQFKRLLRDEPLLLEQESTYLHLACQHIINEDDPSVLWNVIDILLHEGFNPMALRPDGSTPLHVLVQEQPEAMEVIKLFLQYGTNIHHVTKMGLTVLHALAHSYRSPRSCLEAMKLLVSYGADIKAISVNRWSILNTFARYNTDPYDCIQYLLDHGVPVDSRTDEHCTALHALTRCSPRNGKSFRASRDMLKAIKLIVEYGADVNARTIKQWTPLHYVAKNNPNSIETIQYLIEKGANANAVGADGWTALHCLIRYNSNSPTEGIKLLVQAGADVNVLKAGHTAAIHTLAKYCQDPSELYQSMKVLLNAGADVNKEGNKGWTVLHYLVYSNKSPAIVLKLLLEAGAAVNNKVEDGWSALHLLVSSKEESLEALRVLVEHGADINAIGKEGWSVLHCVARCTPKPFESIRFLLQSGVDPRVKADNGWNALHFLANYCLDPAESMRLLLEAEPTGADVNAKTDDGWSVLHIVAHAVRHQTLELLKMLLNYGADVTATGGMGWTVLHSLARYNSEPSECIRLLVAAGADPTKRTEENQTCMEILEQFCPNPEPSLVFLRSNDLQGLTDI